jgi:hypothetical protein
MQINVIKDTQGRVLASFETSGASGAQLKPQLDGEKSVSTMELPDNYVKNLSALYEHVRPVAK